MAALLFDLTLALLACLRLTRFVVADDVPGQWFIKDPLYRLASKQYGVRRGRLLQDAGPIISVEEADRINRLSSPKWQRYLEGLSCPYCVGVWMAGLTTLSLFIAGGPGEAHTVWRYIAGFLALAWLTGHIAARVGDTEQE